MSFNAQYKLVSHVKKTNVQMIFNTQLKNEYSLLKEEKKKPK